MSSKVFSLDIQDRGNDARDPVIKAPCTLDRSLESKGLAVFNKQFGLAAGRAISRGLAKMVKQGREMLKDEDKHQSQQVLTSSEAQEGYHSSATIFDVPDIPLEMILAKVDLPTRLNLAKSNKFLHKVVKNLCFTNNLRTRCLNELTGNWANDERLLEIISSFLDDDWERLLDSSLWDDFFWIGKDLRHHFDHANIDVICAAKFQNFVKNDIMAMYLPKELLDPKFKLWNGSFGLNSWSILPKISTRNVMKGMPSRRKFYVYQNQERCDRNYDIPESLGSVLQVIKLIQPNEIVSVGKANPFKVERNLLVILEEGYMVVSVDSHIRYCTSIKFPYYNWSYAMEMDANMRRTPLIAVAKNILAIWSSPYVLHVNKVVNERPRVSNVVALSEKTEFEANGVVQTNFLGNQWQKYRATNPVHGWGNPLFHITDDPKSFIFRLVHPMKDLTMWRVIKGRGANMVNVREILLRHEGYNDDHNCLKSTPFGQWYPSHNTKLALFWCPDGFVISSNVLQWSWCKWQRILPVNGSSQVHFAKVIDSDLVVIGLNHTLYIATTDCIWDEKGTGITLRIYKQIQIPAYGKDVMIKCVDLEFERGLPYLWVKTESKKKTGESKFDFYFHKVYFRNP